MRVLLFLVLVSGCKARTPTGSNVASSNLANDVEYSDLYQEVERLQQDARAKYAKLQNSGLTSKHFFEEVIALAQDIAVRAPNELTARTQTATPRSIFTGDLKILEQDSVAKGQLATLNQDLGTLEDFFRTWDLFLLRRAHVLTMAHWRAINAIYVAMPTERQPAFRDLLTKSQQAYVDVLKEMAEDESGNSVWRASYIGQKVPSLTRLNRVQGAKNAFATYFAMTNSFLDQVGVHSGMTANILHRAEMVRKTISRYQPYIIGGAKNAKVLADFLRDIKDGGPTIWDDFYNIFERFVKSQGGTIKITGQPLPFVKGNQVWLPPNTLPSVAETGYKRRVAVDTVLFIANHEHPETVTFAHTPLLKEMGFNYATVLTSAQNGFTDGSMALPNGVGPMIAKMMADSSDVFTLQMHGADYPGLVSESIEQFRQARRVGKRLMFLFPQGDNPHGHGGESTRMIPTNAEFIPRLLSRLRDTGEIGRFAVIPLGVSSMERLLYDAGHPEAGSAAPSEYRIEVGHPLLDYEVELLMNLRYRGLLEKEVPSAYTRLVQYAWVEESTRTYRNYPAGIVDLSVMIHDLITPKR